MRLNQMAGIMLAGLMLVGCGNSIVGSWESKDAIEGCSGAEGKLDIDDDLKGDGSITLTDGVSCFDCSFDVDVDEKNNDKYEVRLDFDDCTIGGSSKMEFDCELVDDTLECDSDVAPYDEWERN